ncbi:MAG: DUF1080 domain-containing protein [Bacteroidaceae bacterium]|nr:DUF1080 domain-containing protein [Bacteroidaceae bacterium]
MSKGLTELFSLAMVLVCASAGYAQTLAIDADCVLGRAPQLMYGAGAEDVNHEIYGGLYDQRIFGEGFEEHAPTTIAGWSQYDADWGVTGSVLTLVTDGHGKAVYDRQMMKKGSVAVDVKLVGMTAIAGIIYDVSEEGEGADNFRGYEVALDADDRTFVFGKHDHDWQPVAHVGVSFARDEWNRLQIDFDGRQATVRLNGEKVYDFTDDSTTPLLKGKIGLRSYAGSADFRNLTINGETVSFTVTKGGVSRMWDAVGDGDFSIDTTNPLTGKQCQRIKGHAGTGVANSSLNRWGIGLTKGQEMTGAIYLRGECPKAFVALQSADGTQEYARQEITGITADWKRFALSLTPHTTDPKARFVVGLADEGTLYVDMALLHTDSYPFRKDLTEAFKNEHLTFLRYGGTMVNAAQYMTRHMTGERELREPYTGHWYRYATNGFAIPEFVEFARLIGAEPTFAINIEDNPTDVLALLKEIEPYGLQYIEIGNEECIGTTDANAYQHYIDRYLLLHNALHTQYPDLKFINAAWWRTDMPDLMRRVFEQLDGKCDYWDYHPWTETVAQAKAAERELQQIRELWMTWNPHTTMRVAILEENGNTHGMERALAHGQMLNAVLRMNDFVAMDSPANALEPYKQNDNGWNQGQIFFTPSIAYCQPPYYVQQIAAINHQPLLVSSECQDESVDITACKNEAGDTLVVHVVNALSTKRNIRFNISGFGTIKAIKSYSVAASSLNAENTPTRPKAVAVTEGEVSPTSTTLPIKGHSYTVFVIVKAKEA